VIRAYTADDLDEVLEVWYQASVVAHSFLGEEFFVGERQQVAEHWLPIADTIVYETDDWVRGFLSLIANEVGAVFVHPDEQRSGIGRALMDRARASRPFLELDVFEANAIGRRFYDAYGFQAVGRHVYEPTGHIELRLRLD
jgi:putative acetyltransferase